MPYIQQDIALNQAGNAVAFNSEAHPEWIALRACITQHDICGTCYADGAGDTWVFEAFHGPTARGQGAYAQAVRANGDIIEVYAVRPGSDFEGLSTIDVFNGLSGEKIDREYRVPSASQNYIHRIDPDGYPVTQTDPRRNGTQTIRGIGFWNCLELDGGCAAGGFTFGYGGEAGTDGYTLMAKPDGSIWKYPYGSQRDIRGVIERGLPVIVLSGENAPTVRVGDWELHLAAGDVPTPIPEPEPPTPNPEPPNPDDLPTHMITLEPGETLLVKCVTRRGKGPMVRKLR